MSTLAATNDTATVLSSLADQQRRIHGIVADLDKETVRRAVLPSGWSCAGMIQHLTLTTTFWCADVMAGLPRVEHPEDEFAVDESVSATSLLEAYAGAAEQGAELVRDLPLSAPPAWWPEGWWGGWRLHTLHDVLLHLLVETSCHAGHLDASRELIDGRTWEYPRGRLSEAH
jgi:uncharacterized damage-inducible protein DinB